LAGGTGGDEAGAPKWQLFVPPELAYGPEAVGPKFLRTSLLIFEVNVISAESGNRTQGRPPGTAAHTAARHK